MKLKLKLNKKKLKNLSNDSKTLPLEMTPQIGGGAFTDIAACAIFPTDLCPTTQR